ncbi:MAG: hypothetical protein IT305_23875 [Chloroflexi bacterium]|nr:hypothetical protein [Chloroflexota bacterium]
MLRGRGSHTVRLVLLMIGINVVSIGAWVGLTSPASVGVPPGIVPPAGVITQDGWAWGLGSAIVWLAFFAIAGILVAGRILLMRWMLPYSSSAGRLAAVEKAPSAAPRRMVVEGSADQWMRRTPSA